MGYGSGGCTYGAVEDSNNVETDSTDHFYEKTVKQSSEIKLLNEQSQVKDKEILRLKLKVNDLIKQINDLKKTPLSDDRIFDVLCEKGMLGAVGQNTYPFFLDIARAVEQAHGIKP